VPPVKSTPPRSAQMVQVAPANDQVSGEPQNVADDDGHLQNGVWSGLPRLTQHYQVIVVHDLEEDEGAVGTNDGFLRVVGSAGSESGL
jgi:hypothetical protein